LFENINIRKYLIENVFINNNSSLLTLKLIPPQDLKICTKLKIELKQETTCEHHTTNDLPKVQKIFMNL